MSKGPIHGRLLGKLQTFLCGSGMCQMATWASIGSSPSNTVACQSCHPGITQVKKMENLEECYVCKGDALIKFSLLGRDM